MAPRCLTLAALALVAGCTETNITGLGGASGGTIVFASNREDGNFEIYRVGADGRGLRRLTRDASQTDLSPRLSPDGRRIAWEREIGLPGGGVAAQLWIMNADGTGQRVVVDNGAENRSPDWTADGMGLVYASYVTGNWEIFRTAVAGGEMANLTDNAFADQFPRVSPDGARILFHSNRDFNFEIYVMDADGSGPLRLTSSAADDRFADWTPDGAGIVWSPFTTTFDLHAMNSDGTGERVLLATGFAERHPSVAPDGRLVVFQSDRRAPFGLFVMPMEGGEARELILDGATTGATEIEPQWGAGGR
jgi:TolB protein